MTAILREDPPELPQSLAGVPGLHRVLQHCLEKNPVGPVPDGPRSPVRPRLVVGHDACAGSFTPAQVPAARRAGARRGCRSRADRCRRVRHGPSRPGACAARPRLGRLPVDRVHRAGGVSGDIAGCEGRRLHRARGWCRADLRPPRRRRHAAADHQGQRRSRTPAVVAGFELGRLFFARGSGRPPGNHLADPGARRRASPDHRQRRRWRRRPQRPVRRVPAGRETGRAGLRRGRRVRCPGDRPFHGSVLLQVPAMVSRREVDRLPARRWRPLGSLRRRCRARHSASADARQRPDSRPDVAARQQRCRLQLEPRDDDGVSADAWDCGSSRWREASPAAWPSPTCRTSSRTCTATARSSRAACRCSSISGDTRRRGPRQRTCGTPSASRARRDRCRRRPIGPGDREIAFLSDSGGHANLWITTPATGELRQITYEREPGVAMGVPIWSPDGKAIAFVSSRGNTGLGFGVWLVNPDGGNRAKRRLARTWYRLVARLAVRSTTPTAASRTRCPPPAVRPCAFARVRPAT